MDALQHAKVELKRAELAIEKMKEAKGFDEFEDNWVIFLGSIEKLWVKVERGCQSSKNQFQPWQGHYTKLRKIDPLLKYIKQARDTDSHSIQEIIQKVPEHTEFIPDDRSLPPVFDIPRITLYRVENGKQIEVPSTNPNPGVYRVTPKHVLAKAFSNNGVIYTVPQFHRGQAIKNETSPIVLAGLALNFYKEFLKAAEDKFFSKKDD